MHEMLLVVPFRGSIPFRKLPIHSLFAPGPIRSGERIGPGAKRLGTKLPKLQIHYIHNSSDP